METLVKTTRENADLKRPQALLLFAKIAVVAFALFLCAYGTWVYLPIHRLMALISLIVLLPRFGWVLPTTISGVLFSLSMPKHVNWNPSYDVATIAVLTTGAFLTGCVFDCIANRSHE